MDPLSREADEGSRVDIRSNPPIPAQVQVQIDDSPGGLHEGEAGGLPHEAMQAECKIRLKKLGRARMDPLSREADEGSRLDIQSNPPTPAQVQVQIDGLPQESMQAESGQHDSGQPPETTEDPRQPQIQAHEDPRQPQIQAQTGDDAGLSLNNQINFLTLSSTGIGLLLTWASQKSFNPIGLRMLQVILGAALVVVFIFHVGMGRRRMSCVQAAVELWFMLLYLSVVLSFFTVLK